MTRPRAADDFPVIRARMEELRRERARPRAADDFATIRARMEELRRERAQGLRSRLCRHRETPPAGPSELREDFALPASVSPAVPYASATARRAPIVSAAS